MSYHMQIMEEAIQQLKKEREQLQEEIERLQTMCGRRRPVEHDLRKDPGDVPSDTRAVIALLAGEGGPRIAAWYDHIWGKWVALVDGVSMARGVIAWQELPYFGGM